MQFRSKRVRLAVIVSIAVAAVIAVVIGVISRSKKPHGEPREANQPAPPDLAKHRERFMAGIEALARDDGNDAINHFTSFSYAARPVEEYRLYYLANGYRLAGRTGDARRTLAELWRRNPRLIYRTDVAFHLASLYSAAGQSREAAEVYAGVPLRSDTDALDSAARAEYIVEKFRAGDPAGILLAARNIVVENPNTADTAASTQLYRVLYGLMDQQAVPLTVEDRVRRCEQLLAEGNPESALQEASALNADGFGSPIRERLILVRGLSLNQLRRYADSDVALQPLFSGYFKYAVPALDCSARNNRVLAASINPKVTKTITVRQKVGTVKVRTKSKKLVTRPRYRNVKKQVQLVNLELQKKKDEYDHRYTERLKDLLALPLEAPKRVEVLTTLMARAQEKSQTEYMRDLFVQIVKTDPQNDAGMQYFWGRAWNLYESGDLDGAKRELEFIDGNYANINVKRQTRYWIARIAERKGNKEEASKIYDELANARYEDLYAVLAQSRGAKRSVAGFGNPVKQPDTWIAMADAKMPVELRLAYELSAIGAMREAQLEIRRNRAAPNHTWADAILGEVYCAQGASIPCSRALRSAFPALATVEQDSVPSHFIALDFPLHWEEHIRSQAKKRDVDPFLVMGLIRQESMYNPEIRSGVGAAGLMQLMPATARELAQKLGRRYRDSMLTDPEANIEMGVLYVRQLLNFNGNNVPMTLASYNAGMGNVQNWRRATGGKPADEFVEDIPYSETRNYVKRVIFYRSVYSRRAEP